MNSLFKKEKFEKNHNISKTLNISKFFWIFSSKSLKTSKIASKNCKQKLLSEIASTLWFQLEDMFQLIVTPQGIEKVTIQLIDTPTKVYAIGARLFLSKVPLEVLQNWVLIQLIVTPHILGKVQGQIKEVCRLIEPCLLIGTREYVYTHGLLKNWIMVLCIKYAWPIKSFKTGPPYGLLCAHELMFSAQEVLCSFYSLRMHNSTPKSTFFFHNCATCCHD